MKKAIVSEFHLPSNENFKKITFTIVTIYEILRNEFIKKDIGPIW